MSMWISGRIFGELAGVLAALDEAAPGVQVEGTITIPSLSYEGAEFDVHYDEDDEIHYARASA